MAVQGSGKVADRIQNLISELQSLREEIAQPDTDPTTHLATPKLASDAGRQLKNAVDEFRLFLWAYLDTWAVGGDGPKVRLQKIRMEGAADMLELLADEFRSGLPKSEQAERLRKTIEGILPLLARQ